jgi:hypothetical protein
MAADRARVSYDPTRKWRGLVAQQGRVSVEADWNEAAAIDAERDRRTTLDVVGPFGTPDDGYLITPDDTGDFTIGSGTLYVGGERLDLDGTVTYSTQPEWLDHSIDSLWQDPAVPASDPAYELVYVLASEQEVCAVEDPALADVALGGPDTMQRRRILQRFVRTTTGSPACGSAWDTFTGSLARGGQQFDSASMTMESTATLTVTFGSTGQTSLCQPVATGGYLGAENQMIRVMISSVDSISGVPTIVWGFDDASFLYRITASSSVTDAGGTTTTLTLAEAPVDSYHYPQNGQAVELLGDMVQLTPPDSTIVPPYPGDYIASPHGIVTTVVGTYDPTQSQLVVNGPAPSSSIALPFLRVWQGTALATPAQQVTLGDTGAKVTLDSTGGFRAGDYWRFALRPIQPAIIYPARYQDGPQPPDGPRTWACPLAVITWSAGSGTPLACPPSFPSLTQLTDQGGCCTVDVRPADVGGGATLQALIDTYSARGPVTICLEPGTYVLPEPLLLQNDGLTLQGCRSGVVLQGAASGTFAAGLIAVLEASSVTIRGIELSIPLASFFSLPDGIFGYLPKPNADLLVAYSTDLRMAIGVFAPQTNGLTIEDCRFVFGVEDTFNVFGAGVFATGRTTGVTVSGCDFVVTDPPRVVKFYDLAAGSNIQPQPPYQLTFGYLHIAPSLRVEPGQVGDLRDATIERCLFEGVTVAAFAMTQIGAIRICDNVVRDCYGGFWLISIVDPVYIADFYDIAIGDQGSFQNYSEDAMAWICDRIPVIANAIGELLVEVTVGSADAPTKAPQPPQPGDAGRLKAALSALLGGKRPMTIAPVADTGTGMTLQLDLGGCLVDAVVADSYSGSGLLVLDFTPDPGSALVHDNRIRTRFSLGEAASLIGLTRACVTANQIANEVVPTGEAVGAGADSLSIVVSAGGDLYVGSPVAITGNVFVDPTLLPPRPASIAAVLRDWDVLNTVLDYPGPPVVTSLTPTEGTQGTIVTVTGTALGEASLVLFGGFASTNTIPVSPTEVSAVAPPGSGTVDVTVTNPLGTSAIAQPDDQFTYAAPVVTGVNPTEAVAGTTVTISGQYFTGLNTISFGAFGNDGINFVDDGTVTAVAPQGYGTVDVTVTTPAGTSAISQPADQFTFEIIIQ